jgi:protein involved in polysaccharide export with SLBB domain
VGTLSHFVAVSSCRVMFVFFSACALAACTDVADNLPPGTSAPPMQTVYLIQPGDILDVKFVKNPELNEQPTVQPDGRISMLYAPNLGVGGRSLEDVRAALDGAYGKELKEPGVSVNVKGPVLWHVYIGGQVTKPSDYTNSGPTPSLSAAIAYAGGILDSGDSKKIVLTRLQPDHTRKAYILDYLSAAQGKNPAGDIQLAAYDAIYIPKTGVADVYTAYNQYFKQFLPNYGIGLTPSGF